jgi:trimeric autotransporter adhesin
MIKIEYIKSTITAIILCSLLLSCSVLHQVPLKENRIPTNGLVAYYPFDNNAVDKSGNNNDGIVNGPILTSDRKGNMNSAYAFDGVDDYIYVSDSEILRITGQITMSVWFKTDYTLPFAGLICKAEPYEIRHGYLMDIDNHNKVRADVIYDHSNGVGGTLVSNNVLIDNKWHHVLATYNGKKFKLYIDGKLDNKIVYKKGLQSNTEPLLIGWDQNTWLSHRHFEGSIDDIRIFNRALNKKEISELYNEN